MFTYTFVQWLTLFYFYCFVGWIWESCYVSLCDKKWTNRGFLKGPFLPIYGSGACIILMATLPVKDNYVLIFILGMLSATFLEYITGVVMESIFKVRYWDYSNEKFNLNGHICLLCSLAWGGFSILMVKIIHRPIDKLLYSIPKDVLEIIIFVITVMFVIDLTSSIRDALDFKEMLTKFTENNNELKRLQKRLDVLIAVLDDEKSEIAHKLGAYKSESIEKLNTEFDVLKEKLFIEKDRISLKHIIKRRSANILKRNPSATSKLFSEALDYFKKRM